MSVTIGVVSFVGPFVVATLIAVVPLGWSLKGALIAKWLRYFRDKAPKE